MELKYCWGYESFWGDYERHGLAQWFSTIFANLLLSSCIRITVSSLRLIQKVHTFLAGQVTASWVTLQEGAVGEVLVPGGQRRAGVAVLCVSSHFEAYGPGVWGTRSDIVPPAGIWCMQYFVLPWELEGTKEINIPNVWVWQSVIQILSLKPWKKKSSR